MQTGSEVLSVFKALHRCRDPSAAVNELGRRLASYRHYRAAAEKSAELKGLALFLADSRNNAYSRGLGVDHSYCCRIGNYRGDSLRSSVSRL